jgi:hypothetical protein
MANIRCSCDSDRRSFLKKTLGFTGGLFGMSLLNRFFMEEAYGITPDAGTQLYDACIQIFYSGGPSQTDTWDPKPGSVNNYFPTISLGTNDIYGRGINLSDVFQNISNLVQNDSAIDLGIVRSMTHGNGSHSDAQRWMNCYWQSPVEAIYPSTAAAMAYLQDGNSPTGIPSVLISGSNGNGSNDAKGSTCPTAFLSTGSATSMLRRPSSTDAARYQRRRDLIKMFNAEYVPTRPDAALRAWDAAIDKAYDVTVNGSAAAAFDLNNKPRLPGGANAPSGDITRLTLAQELVKAGIPYVSCGIGGNDTHSGNMARVRRNWGDTTDVAVAQMAQNLKATGKRVLIIMGGEFGRTPQTVAPKADGSVRDGRDHWPDGFSWAMLSINQPAFNTTAVGDTGPDGIYRERNGNLIDPVYPSALGGLVYRAMGFPIGSGEQWDIPTSVGNKPPVDTNIALSTAPGGGTWLMQQFGLA